MKKSTIKFFISCHKPTILPKGPYFCPIQVGAALTQERFPGMLHDDTGDNISDRNKRYCELTAQYWAWKNDSSDYVGFCHYRRYFSFAPEHLEADSDNLRGIVRELFSAAVCDELYLNDERQIRRVVNSADVWLTDPHSFGYVPGYEDMYLQYGSSLDLHEKDLRTAIAVLKEQHPEYSEVADAYLSGTLLYACNMFIMRRAIFERYCQWLFPILDETDRRLDYTGYNAGAMRTIGHIAERLLGVFCTYLMQNEPECRVDCLQRVYLEITDPSEVHKREKQRMPVYSLRTADRRQRMLTTSEQEKAALESGGWLCDGVARYAPGYGTPVYRLFNPNARGNNHRFTASKAEIKILTARGWKIEGVAWFSTKKQRSVYVPEEEKDENG